MQRQEELGVQFGKYRVFSKLAVGGMAELFLARQPGIGGFQKTVVLKCILPHLAQEDDFVQMFLDEARIASPLNHPNIVQIFEIGEEVGVYFISMEYIRGHNLREFRQRLYRHHPDVKPYNLCAGIIAQVASGLQYAHNAPDDNGYPLNLVHRDISPTNLLISYNGVVKLVDFGVAKAESQQHQTSAGTIKGKYRYMSPEQIRGHDLDQRSDIFSLGICLYEASTNVGLFGRRHEAEVIDAVRNARVTPPSKFRADYPPALEEIVLKALALDPNERYQHADEMRAALESFMHNDGLYYGTAQVGELIQFLFSSEQAQNLTSASALPLSPTDFVRFLGEIPTGMTSGARPSPIPSQSEPDSTPSSVQHSAMPAPSSQDVRSLSSSTLDNVSGEMAAPVWSAGSSSEIKTPTSGLQVRSASGSTPAPSRSNIISPPPLPQSPSRPGIPSPSRPGIPSPSRTRDEVLEDSGLRRLPTSAFDTFEVDESVEAALHLEEDSPTEIYPSDEFADAGDTNPSIQAVIPVAMDDFVIQRKSSARLWPFFLLLGGIVGGVIAAFSLGLFSQEPDETLLQQQQVVINQNINNKKYTDARSLLRKFQGQTLPDAYVVWAEKIQQRLAILPQLDVAQDLYSKKRYNASLHLLRQLLRQAPQEPSIRTWLDKVTDAIKAEKKKVQDNPVKPLARVVTPRPVYRPTRRKIQRRRWRRRRRRRSRRVAMRRNQRPPPPVVQEGYLSLMSSPSSTVFVNGEKRATTPLRLLLPVGRYRVRFVRSGYRETNRNITVVAARTVSVRASLQRLFRPRPRPIRREPVIPIAPKPRVIKVRPPAPRAKASFQVSLPRRKSIRIFISDPRGIGGLQMTSNLKQYSRRIERAVSRTLNGASTAGITRAWQRYVRERATRANKAYYSFNPRAIAYVIFFQLQRGRSSRRVSQILVKYERFGRFKRYGGK